MQPLWKDTFVAPCGTYHVLGTKPLYDKRFNKVLKFHEPGYAAVRDETGSYHINIDGWPAYSNRYIKSFGFYNHYAAVESTEGCHHISIKGLPFYNERYAWCGNFQEGACVVKDKPGYYFHINSKGNPLYTERYAYVGDYKDRTAVVCSEQGLSTHIDQSGNMVHGKWFQQLDIFHKDFARARDAEGWFHITKKGEAIYKERYSHIEPYYNGIAHVERFDGSILLIDEEGHLQKQIRGPLSRPQDELSGDMVGFWKTYIIWTAVNLNILDYFPSTIENLALKAHLAKTPLKRLIRALWEIGIVEPLSLQDEWQLTPKGQCLVPTSSSAMASATQLWVDSNTMAPWSKLPSWLKENYEGPHLSFKDQCKDRNQLAVYETALEGYAKQDFNYIYKAVDWSQHKKVIALGRTGFALLKDILNSHQHLQADYLCDTPSVNDHWMPTLASRIRIIQHNIFEAWPNKGDAILLPRFLHYWNNEFAEKILYQARQALQPNGFIYILEMVLLSNNPSGGMLDLNMLIETGGKERDELEWAYLFKKVGLAIYEIKNLSSIASLMILRSES